MLKKSLKIFVFCAIIIMPIHLLAQEQPRVDVLERVIAVVNGKPIFLSELRTRIAPLIPRLTSVQSQSERMAILENAYQRVLEQLIQQQLIEQEAERLDVEVTLQEIDQAIVTLQRQNNLTEVEFWQAVNEQANQDEAQYRETLKQQLLAMKLINQQVRARVNITEADVRRNYDEEARRRNRGFRFRASHIFIPFDSTVNATEVESTRIDAEHIRAEITDQNSFELLMRENQGGSLGWLSQGDLPSDLEQVLMTLQPGEISTPVQGSRGFHIFFLYERESGDASMPSFEELHDQIYQGMLDEAMSRQERLYMQELERNAHIVRRLEQR